MTQRRLLQRGCRIFMADVSCGLMFDEQQPADAKVSQADSL